MGVAPPIETGHATKIYRPQAAGGDKEIIKAGGLLVSENLLWGNCPLVNAVLDPSLAVWLEEEYLSYNAQATTGDYVATQATAGTAVIHTGQQGAILLDAGASTAHEGIQIQRVKSAFLPALTKDLWFEATIELGTALTAEVFVGLGDVDTTAIASGALHLINCIGFSSVTGDGVMLFNCNKASTDNTPAASPITLSLTVPHKLGFYYDGTADTVQAFVDSVAVGAPIATTNIPKVAIYPTLVCQSTGTSEPTMTVSALRVFQLR